MTTRIRIISGVAGTSFDVPAAAYNGELLGVWGQKAPGSTGAGLKVLLGVGKAHGFSGLPPALIKRKRHLQGLFLLTHYAEISLSRVVPVSLPPGRREHILAFPLDNIRLFSRSEDRG